MRIRILEAKDEDDQWYQEAYAYKAASGRVMFVYNLLWERVGSYYNDKLKETGVSLEKIETMIEPDNDDLRWLPVEVIEENEVGSVISRKVR